jgi:hypothetical protein
MRWDVRVGAVSLAVVCIIRWTIDCLILCRTLICLKNLEDFLLACRLVLDICDSGGLIWLYWEF